MFRHWKLLSLPVTAHYRKVTEIGGAASIAGLCLLFGPMLCGGAIYIHRAAVRADLAASTQDSKVEALSPAERETARRTQRGRLIVLALLVAAKIWNAYFGEARQGSVNPFDQFDQSAAPNQAKPVAAGPWADFQRPAVAKPAANANPIVDAWRQGQTLQQGVPAQGLDHPITRANQEALSRISPPASAPVNIRLRASRSGNLTDMETLFQVEHASKSARRLGLPPRGAPRDPSASR